MAAKKSNEAFGSRVFLGRGGPLFLSLSIESPLEGPPVSGCGQRSRELCEKTAGRRVEILLAGLEILRRIWGK